ncbi:MAG: hypothetical protein V4627_03275 [Pseudomonadota bacterium]
MTYQGARSRPAESETKRFFSVSKIRLDDQGFATHVLWSEVDSRSNLDVGDQVVVPVGEVVDALRDGAQVRVVFAPPHPPLPHQTLEVIGRADGSDTVALVKRPGLASAPQSSLHDIAALGDHAQPKKALSSFSSRRRAHGVFAVSKVGLDADGRVTHVQWGRVDTATNLWMGAEAVAPVADAVAAVQAGDQVFALFASTDGHLPGRQFTSVDYDDGRQTIVLQGAPKAGHEIHDMDRLTDTVPS